MIIVTGDCRYVVIVLRFCVLTRGLRLRTDHRTSYPTALSGRSDAPHRDGHLLLALRLPIERLTAFAEVIERGGARIVLGCRPVKSVRLQPIVHSINRAIATQHGVEA